MRILFAGMNKLADAASIDALNPKSGQYGQCVDICNCDIDDENNAITRSGYVKRTDGAITTLWGNRGKQFCIKDGRLYSISAHTMELTHLLGGIPEVGPELLASPGFEPADPAPWVVGLNWSIVEEGFDMDPHWVLTAIMPGGSGEVTQQLNLESAAYLVEYTVEGYESGAVFVSLGGVVGESHSADGTYQDFIYAPFAGLQDLAIRSDFTPFVGKITRISLKKILVGVYYFSEEVEFTQVNDIVFFSDGSLAGTIDQYGTARLIDYNQEWADVVDVETWVKTHYPADPAEWDGFTSNSNFEVDAFKLKAKAGRRVEFYNGAVYMAISNFVYCTKTFDVEHMDIRANIVSGHPDPVTMIAHVTDGLYVGTTKALYFLAGGGYVIDEKTGNVTGAFSQRKVASYGVYPGTKQKVPASLVPATEAEDDVILCATPMGIIACQNSGRVTPLSVDKIVMPGFASGCSMFRGMTDEGGLRQYVVCLKNGNNKATWVLNTMTGVHSRYTNFDFTGFYHNLTKGAYYGSISQYIDAGGEFLETRGGLYELTGDLDFAGETGLQAQIEAYALTPSFDFGKREVKSLAALYVQARCNGSLAIDYYVNETFVCGDDLITFDDNSAGHTLRAHPPRGLRGTFLQLKLKNVNGSSFTAFHLDPVLHVSSGRTR